MTSTHIANHTPLQNTYYIKVQPRALHNRLAVMTEPVQNNNQEIPGMKLSTNTVEMYMDIQECLSTYETQDELQNDEHLQVLIAYIIKQTTTNKTEVNRHREILDILR